MIFWNGTSALKESGRCLILFLMVALILGRNNPVLYFTLSSYGWAVRISF